MRVFPSFGLSVAVIAVAVACVTGAPGATTGPSVIPTTAPATAAPVTPAPATAAPVTAVPVTAAPVTPVPATAGPATAPPPTPNEGLDPSLSDAGVVGRITIDGPERDPGNPRNGTHDIIGVAADGSRCGPSDLDDGYTAVAWNYLAPNNEPRQMFVVVAVDDIPTADGSTNDILDGRAGADFNSETGFGTLYFGDATRERDGNATIDVTRIGDLLVFEYEGVTWDAVRFSGQMVCAEV